MPVVFTLGTGLFTGLNAQEVQKLSFSLQYPLSSGLLNAKVEAVPRQGWAEGGREESIDFIKGLGAQNPVCLPDSSKDVLSDLQGLPLSLGAMSARI